MKTYIPKHTLIDMLTRRANHTRQSATQTVTAVKIGGTIKLHIQQTGKTIVLQRDNAGFYRS